MKRTKKKHLTKGDIAFLLQEIMYDVADLAYGSCEDPISTAHDIKYGLNVVMEQFDKYYIEVKNDI